MDSFTDLLTHNLAPILVLDSNHIIATWNQSAENLYRWTQLEALGKDANLLFRTEFPQPVEQVVQRLKDHGEWKGEVIRSKKGGEKIEHPMDSAT